MDEIASFGEWVQIRRETLRLTRKGLAALVGCAPVTIKKIERDERRPSAQMASLLAAHLALPDPLKPKFSRWARGEFVVGLPAPGWLGDDLEAGQFTGRQDLSRPALPRLPQPPTPFVGREEEQTALKALIQRDSFRLITILGAGGMGKTRLAIQVAHSLPPAGPFADGIFFVDLAPVTEPERILPAVADAVEMQREGQSGRSPREQLFAFLARKRLLLILDNFEHLLAGAALLSQLMERAPAVKLLVTSRERLNLRGEQVFPLDGLAGARLDDLEAALSDPAAALFLQSAQRIQPDFALSESQLPALDRILTGVEGMPLAIELAAGWVDALPLEDISAEIESGLDFFESELRDAPPRHRSMRAVIDYSWRRLTDRERTSFARLAVFRGGFTREAARAVTEADRRLLSRLVSKSFLRFSPAQGRYAIHELMRQFGAEALAAAPEEWERINQRHCTYFCDTLQVLGEGLKKGRQLDTLAEIRLDLDNGRAAWEWAFAHRDLTQLFKATFVWYDVIYKWNTQYEEINSLLDRTLALISSEESSLARQLEFNLLAIQSDLHNRLGLDASRLQAARRGVGLLSTSPLKDGPPWPGKYLAQTLLSGQIDDWEVGFDLCQESVAVFRERQDAYGMALSLYFLSSFYDTKGEIEKRAAHIEDSWRIARELGNLHLSGEARIELAWIAHERGEFARARQLAEEVLAEAKKINRHFGVASCCRLLGWNGLISGDFAAAYRAYEESLLLYEAYGYENQAFQARYDLGHAALHAGDYQEAGARLESVPIHQIDDPNSVIPAITCGVLGQLALVQADQEQAVQLLAESVARLRPRAHEMWWFPQFLAFHAIGLTAVGEVAEAHRLVQEALVRSAADPRWHTGIILAGAAMVLAGELKSELAVEIYAAACSHPHVGQSKWYQAVVGAPIEQGSAHLSAEVSAAARGRGRRERLAELQAVVQTLSAGFS